MQRKILKNFQKKDICIEKCCNFAVRIERKLYSNEKRHTSKELQTGRV